MTPIEDTCPTSRGEVEACPVLCDTLRDNVDRRDSSMIDVRRSHSASPMLESTIDVPRVGWVQYQRCQSCHR